MKKMNNKGFTLVEIMIVVAIIGLLAAIGIPSFQKARANSVKKSMENNARIVISAAEQYAMENALGATDTVTSTNILAYVKGGSDALNVGAQTATIPNGSAMSFFDSGITNVAGTMYGNYGSM